MMWKMNLSLWCFANASWIRKALSSRQWHPFQSPFNCGTRRVAQACLFLFNYPECALALLGTSDGTTPSFIRGEVVFPAYYTGLDPREAKKIMAEMVKLAEDRGLKLSNSGWMGPMHGVKVPYVIPTSAKDTPKCE